MKTTLLFTCILLTSTFANAQAFAWEYFTDSLPYINTICHDDNNHLYCTAVNANRLIKLNGNGTEEFNQVLQYNGVRYSISKMIMAYPDILLLCGYNTAGKGYVAKIDEAGTFTELVSVGEDSVNNTVSDMGLSQGTIYFTGTVNVLDTNTQQYHKNAVTGRIDMQGNLSWLQYSADAGGNMYGKQIRAINSGYWLLEHFDSLQYAELRLKLGTEFGQVQFTKTIYRGHLDFNNTVALSDKEQTGMNWNYEEDHIVHVGFNYRDSLFDNLLKGRIIAVDSAGVIKFDRSFAQNSMFYLNSFNVQQSNNVIDVSGAGLYLNTLDSVFLEYYPKLYRLNSAGDIVDSIQESTAQPIGAYNTYIPYNNYGLLTGGMVNSCPYRRLDDQSFQLYNSLDIANRIGLTAHVGRDEYPVIAGYRVAQYRAFVTKVNSYLDVEKTKDDLQLTVHPNPTTTYIWLNVESKEAMQYKVYDLQGKLVAGADYERGVPIDVSTLPSGFYTGYLFTASNKKAFKFVVQ